MKKMMSLLLSVLLVLSLSATVFAEDKTMSEPGNYTGNIQASYDQKPDPVVNHKYTVVIGWEQSGTLKYKEGQDTYSWNTDDVKYDKNEGKASWEISDAKIAITVTNKSDSAVTATCDTPVFNEGLTVTGSYGENASSAVLNLASASKGLEVPGASVGETATYSITAIDGAITAAGNIGTITVSLSTGAGN